MKILAVSDQVVERIYALISSGQLNDVDLLLGCGDLPYSYLENLISMLNVPTYYVPGNHDPAYDPYRSEARVDGGTNVDLKLVRVKGLLIGGFGGSIEYRPYAVNQYSQADAYIRHSGWRRACCGIACAMDAPSIFSSHTRHPSAFTMTTHRLIAACMPSTGWSAMRGRGIIFTATPISTGKIFPLL